MIIRETRNERNIIFLPQHNSHEMAAKRALGEFKYLTCERISHANAATEFLLHFSKSREKIGLINKHKKYFTAF
jgi:hypothetical protein